jgi:hypothetical protein
MAATNVQAFSGDVEVASNLAVDTNVLFVDSVNNKVGVGTTSPQEKIHIYGAPMVQHDTTYVNTSGGNAWYKLGVWKGSDSTGQGANLKLTLLGGSGFNAASNNKSGETVIHAKLLNNFDAGVANIGGMFHSLGNPVVYNVKFKQVSSNRYEYEVHAETPSYTKHNMSVECSDTTSFTRDFTVSSDPGEDSDTVRAAKFTHAINESGNVGIGTTEPASKLHIVSPSSKSYASLDNLRSNASVRINSPVDGNDCFVMGLVDENADDDNNMMAYMQNIWDGGGSARDLLINPFGGRVGFGTNRPADIGGGNANLVLYRSAPGFLSGTSNKGGGITFYRSGSPAGFRGGAIYNAAVEFMSQTAVGDHMSASECLVFATGFGDPTNQNVNTQGSIPNMLLSANGQIALRAAADSAHSNLFLSYEGTIVRKYHPSAGSSRGAGIHLTGEAILPANKNQQFIAANGNIDLGQNVYRWRNYFSNQTVWSLGAANYQDGQLSGILQFNTEHVTRSQAQHTYNAPGGRSRVTVNVPGKYLLGWGGFAYHPTQTTHETWLYVNGSQYNPKIRAYAGGVPAGGYNMNLWVSAIVNLNASDYVELAVGQGGYHGNEACFFYGYQLC